jgi:hypothetical protein
VFFPGARASEEKLKGEAFKEQGQNCEVDGVGREENDAVVRQIDEEQEFEEIGEHVVADVDGQFDKRAEESQQLKHEPRTRRTELSSRSIKRATVESVKEVAGRVIMNLLIMMIIFATLTRQQVPMDSIVL